MILLLCCWLGLGAWVAALDATRQLNPDVRSLGNPLAAVAISLLIPPLSLAVQLTDSDFRDQLLRQNRWLTGKIFGRVGELLFGSRGDAS